MLQNTDTDRRRRAPKFVEILLYVNRPSDLSVPHFHHCIFVFRIFACVSVSSGRRACVGCSVLLLRFVWSLLPLVRAHNSAFFFSTSLSSPASFSLFPSTSQKINRYRYICVLECWLISTHFNDILLPLPGPSYRSKRPFCRCRKPEIGSFNGYLPRIPLFYPSLALLSLDRQQMRNPLLAAVHLSTCVIYKN